VHGFGADYTANVTLGACGDLRGVSGAVLHLRDRVEYQTHMAVICKFKMVDDGCDEIPCVLEKCEMI